MWSGDCLKLGRRLYFDDGVSLDVHRCGRILATEEHIVGLALDTLCVCDLDFELFLLDCVEVLLSPCCLGDGRGCCVDVLGFSVCVSTIMLRKASDCWN